MDNSFLDGTDAPKGRWRDLEAEKRGIRPAYRWTGLGRDGLEVVYGTAGARPSTTVVRDVWKQRHGYRAAPLLVVVAYPQERPNEAVVCGPAGDNPTVVDLDLSRAERLAEAALGEPHRHLAIRSLSSPGPMPYAPPDRESARAHGPLSWIYKPPIIPRDRY